MSARMKVREMFGISKMFMLLDSKARVREQASQSVTIVVHQVTLPANASIRSNRAIAKAKDSKKHATTEEKSKMPPGSA